MEESKEDNLESDERDQRKIQNELKGLIAQKKRR